jgi:TM2 domain-containing membrane protein YozV
VWLLKASSKAALLSALIFPGVGQIYLKRYLRGLIPMVLVLTGLGVLVARATFRALEIIEKMQAAGGAIDMNVAANLAATSAASGDPYSSPIILGMFCCWTFSVIDAYMLGSV